MRYSAPYDRSRITQSVDASWTDLLGATATHTGEWDQLISTHMYAQNDMRAGALVSVHWSAPVSTGLSFSRIRRAEREVVHAKGRERWWLWSLKGWSSISDELKHAVAQPALPVATVVMPPIDGWTLNHETGISINPTILSPDGPLNQLL
jgi:hypothetical protein